MGIEVKLRIDGEVKRFSRPDTTVREMQDFKDMRAKIRQKQIEVQSIKDPEELLQVDFRQIEREMDEMQVNFIIDLFKDHESFTYDEFMNGMASKEYDKELRRIFKEIDPAAFEENDGGKKSASRSSKRT